MVKYSSHDDYLDAATGVLKNRLNMKTAAALETAEATFVGIRLYELARRPLRGRFDLAHLKAIHRYLFQDVYDWAGQCRTIDISRGDTRFAHHRYIEAAARPVFEQLAKEKYLAGLGVDDFSERAAHYLGEINALHPFREGNGRAQREFISHLAYKCGHFIDWKKSQPAADGASVDRIVQGRFVAVGRLHSHQP
jgi:cell filamentation protein